MHVMTTLMTQKNSKAQTGFSHICALRGRGDDFINLAFAR